MKLIDKMKLIEYIFCSITGLYLGIFSKILVTLPIQALNESFYQKWLTSQGGHLTNWCLIVWFAVCGFNVLATYIRNKQSLKKITIVTLIELSLIIPILPIIDSEKLIKNFYALPDE